MFPTTPTIQIHFAQDEIDDSQVEIKAPRSPYSPKFSSPMAYENSDAEDFRPNHLMPPPVVSPITRSKLSALPTDKKGIDQERFAELLRTSRERAVMKHGRKESFELRRQVTLKAHTTKALERRAMFLSKLQSPPSPNSTDSPVTPPESPAVFHFSLPSPGMQSPLALFDTIAKQENGNSVNFPSESYRRVEEVDFKARVRSDAIRGRSNQTFELDLAAPKARHVRRVSALGLPSLDQITARLAKSGNLQSNSAVAPNITERIDLAEGRPRLIIPNHKRSPSSPIATSPVPPIILNDEIGAADHKPVEAKSQVVNRLPTFLQKRAAAVEDPKISQSVAPAQVVKVPVAHTVPSISVVLSAPPIGRRRPSNPPPPKVSPSQPSTTRPTTTRPSVNPASSETRKQRGQDMVEKLRRRSSAPAKLPLVVDKKSHPVLMLKGSF